VTQNLTGRAAAAAAPMGKRVAAAGFGPCSTCRHPARLHGSFGCSTGECECVTTGDELRAGAPTIEVPVAAPSAAQLALLDVRCTCGHVRTEHRVAGSSVICKTCPCHAYTVPTGEEPDASVAPPVEASAPPPVAAAPAPAHAPTVPTPVAAAPARPADDRVVAPVVELPPWLPGTGVPYVKPAPAGPPPGWDPHAPKRDLGLHTPGAAMELLRREHPELVPEITAEDEARADEIIAEGKAAAARLYARRSSRRIPARPAATPRALAAAVVGERDAVEEVAVAAGDVAATEPEPSDVERLLARALWVSTRWYCPRCHSWPADPGACALCADPLQAVYLVTVPRELS
jgi:hypothetical protein